MTLDLTYFKTSGYRVYRVMKNEWVGDWRDDGWEKQDKTSKIVRFSLAEFIVNSYIT